MTQSGGPDAVARLAREVAQLGGRLREISEELRVATGTVVLAAPAPAPPPPYPAPTQNPPPYPAPPRNVGPPPGRPPQLHGPRPGPPVPPPPPSWWQREGAASRVLAVAGSVVTLIGVVLLLVLAAQGGYFGPVPRVVGGVLLGAALLAVAVRVRARPGGRTGALALAGTGVAVLYLDVVAISGFYEWVPAPVGLLLAVAVAAVGAGLAELWRSQTLAVGVAAGAALTTPFLVDDLGLLLTGYLLVLTAGALTGWVRHGWPVLLGVGLVPVTVVVGATDLATVAGDVPAVEAITGAVLLTGLGVTAALLAQHRRRTDRLAVVVVPALSAVTLLSAPVLERWPAAGVALAVAVVAAVLSQALRWLAAPGRTVLVGVAGVGLLQATALAADGPTTAVLVLGQAVAAAALAHRLRSRAVLTVAGLYLVWGGLSAVNLVPPEQVSSSSSAVAGASLLNLLTVLVLAVAVLTVAAELAWSRWWNDVRAAWVAAGCAALYGLTAAVVTAAVLVLGDDGFVVGHTVATLGWTVLALVLLARGLRPGEHASLYRVAGLVLAAAAVGKLLLFDLSTLSGVARVLAFLVTGLLLLTAGTRYARKVAEQQESAPVT